jgi:hypothetical protein
MCHSCVSRNPDCTVPAAVFLHYGYCRVPALCLLPCSCTVATAVFLDRKQGPGTMDSFSILDSRLRGNDTPGERALPVFPSSSLSQWGRGEDDK